MEPNYDYCPYCGYYVAGHDEYGVFVPDPHMCEPAEKYYKAQLNESSVKNKWIKLNAMPPPYGVDVLVYFDNNSTMSSSIKITHRTHTDVKGEHFANDLGHYVTHWMPLPFRPDIEGET